MRTIFLALIAMIGLLALMVSPKPLMANASEGSETTLVSSSAPSTKASVAGDVQIAFEQTSDETETPGNFLVRNWGALLAGLLAFYDVVARLTPTTKDNSIVNFLTSILNVIVPNFKKGGGVF